MRRLPPKPHGARTAVRALLCCRTRRTFATTYSKGTPAPGSTERPDEQAMQIGRYYQIILDSPQPIPPTKAEEPPTTSSTEPEPEPLGPPSKDKKGRKPKEAGTSASQVPEQASSPSPPHPTSSTDTAEAKARIIFGSRLIGPAERAERLAAIRSKSTLVAGVMVPPRPEEPENCCMSGCVNCVWDRYRDEVEEWATAHREAERRLRAQEAAVATTADSMAATGRSTDTDRPELDRGPVSMDDDGGGSTGSWGTDGLTGQRADTRLTKDFWDDRLYQNVPVGIREFMKQEKRLKEKHMQEKGTSGR